jgi:hypothetical protein
VGLSQQLSEKTLSSSIKMLSQLSSMLGLLPRSKLNVMPAAWAIEEQLSPLATT